MSAKESNDGGRESGRESVDTCCEYEGRRSRNSTSSGRRSTPLLASTPHRRTPSLKTGAKLMRTSSSASSNNDDNSVQSYRALLKERLLITQPNDDNDDDMFDFRESRMSRDTDYETDLDMDYDEWIAEDNNILDEKAPQDTKYIHICNQTGTIPVSYFLRHKQDTHFRMRYHGLGPLGAKAIALPLKDNHDIETLDLEGNWVEKEGVKYLSDMLRENIYLTDVNLAENRLGRDGAEELCDMLYKNEFLLSLNLSGNNLQDYGAGKICEMLQKNSTLKRLYLTHNQFEEKAAFHFKEALSHNESLELLDISWNHFRTHGAVAIAEGVQENYGLKSINVAMNGFSGIGAEAFGRALKHNRGLAELDISHNRVPEEGAGHIALGLQTNDSLKVLKIGYNPLGADGPLAILVAISKNDISCMTRLDLSDVVVSPEFKELQQNLERERPFTVIHGGVLMEREDYEIILDSEGKESFQRDPFGKLRSYCRKAGYRLIDLFRDLDKDSSMTITKDELINGLKAAGIPVTMNEINIIVQNLDKDRNGMIDYQELLLGDRDYKDRLAQNLECPEDRIMQEGMNRLSFSREKSGILENILAGL